MNLLQGIIATIVASAILTAVVSFLRRKQLCAVVRRFGYSDAPDNELSLLSILNRGHSSEEEVRVELDPRRTYAIAGQSIPDVSLENNVIRVPRIPSGNDIAVLLRVGGGDFSQSSVHELSSSKSKGRVYPGLDKVPQMPRDAAGSLALFLFFVATLVGFTWFITKDTARREMELEALRVQTEATKKAAESIRADLGSKPPLSDAETSLNQNRIDSLTADGWNNVDEWAKTEWAKSYGPAEFPVRIKPKTRRGKLIDLEVMIDNRTSDWWEVTVSLTASFEQPPQQDSDGLRLDVVAYPNTQLQRQLTVYLPSSAPVREAGVKIWISDNKGKLLLVRRSLDLSRL